MCCEKTKNPASPKTKPGQTSAVFSRIFKSARNWENRRWQKVYPSLHGVWQPPPERMLKAMKKAAWLPKRLHLFSSDAGARPASN
jgi:hypothetical protein